MGELVDQNRRILAYELVQLPGFKHWPCLSRSRTSRNIVLACCCLHTGLVPATTSCTVKVPNGRRVRIPVALWGTTCSWICGYKAIKSGCFYHFTNVIQIGGGITIDDPWILATPDPFNRNVCCELINEAKEIAFMTTVDFGGGSPSESKQLRHQA